MKIPSRKESFEYSKTVWQNSAHGQMPGDNLTVATPSQYDLQAQSFLDKFGIKFRAVLSDSKPCPWKDDTNIASGSGHHYRVTMSKRVYSGPEQDRRPIDSRLVFDFWGSIHDAEQLVKADKALQDMQLQVQNTEPHLRINWQEELEARKARVNSLHASAYDVLACISRDANSKRLRAFFTEQEIEALQEIQ